MLKMDKTLKVKQNTAFVVLLKIGAIIRSSSRRVLAFLVYGKQEKGAVSPHDMKLIWAMKIFGPRDS
jgi:hypothetical protein